MKNNRLIAFTFLAFLLVSVQNIWAQTYSGDITLKYQQEVDDFGADGYTEIDGRLRILTSFNDTVNPIIDLSPLSTLQKVEEIFIIGCYALPSLSGLEGLTTVDKNVRITNLDSIIDLSGLEGLTNIGERLVINGNKKLSSINLNNLSLLGTGIKIASNENLESLDGLTSLTSLGSIHIGYNPSLTSIEQLEIISGHVNFIRIDSNLNLPSLSGLENITSVGELIIDDNNSIINLNGLGSLLNVFKLKINNNALLTTLDGLINLIDFSIINITGNPVLTNYCPIELAVSNGVTTYLVEGNVFNPTLQDMQLGYCNSTPISVGEAIGEETIYISPNPSNGVFQINLSSHKNVNIEIINQLGQNIYRFSHINQPIFHVDLNLPKGVYFAKLSNETNNEKIRFIVL